MQTTDIVAGAIVMLLISLVLGSVLGHAGPTSAAFGAKIFIEVWVLLGIASTLFGLAVHRHRLVQEARSTLMIFGVPVLVAALIWWRLS